MTTSASQDRGSAAAQGPIVLVEVPINPVTLRFGLSAIAQYPPLPQVRLAGQMPEEDVRIVDLRLRGEQPRFHAMLREDPPAVVGLSTTFTSNGDEAIRVAETVRRLSPETIIVLGGTAPSEDPAAFWDSEADFICRRRGDASLPALVRQLRREGCVESPAGFLFREDGAWKAAPDLPSPPLEALRPGAWHLLPRRNWKSYYQGFKATGMSQMSEGCPYDCNFCSVWMVHGRRTDVAALENVQHDLEQLPPYAANHFFADDIWLQGTESQRRELFDPLLDWVASDYLPRRSDLQLTVETRADLFLRENERFRDWIRHGGLRKIFFGIEAVTNEQLQAYSKRISVDRNSDAIRQAAELGVYVVAQFVIPCDATRSYFDEIVRFLEAHRDTIRAANFTIATPLPGTVLYQEMLAEHPELADRSVVTHPAFSLYTALLPTRLEPAEFYEQVARVYGAARQIRVSRGGIEVFLQLMRRTPWLLGHILRLPFALRRLVDGRTFLETHYEVQGDRLLADPARAAA